MRIKTIEGLLAVFILLLSVFTFRPAYDYTLARLLIANIFVFLGALHFFGRQQPFSAPRPVLFSLAGFLLFVAISVSVSVFPPATLKELPHLLTYVLIFLVISQIYPTPFVISSWIVAAIILSFVGLHDHNRIQMIVTPLGNKNFFAGYLILVIPITIAVLGQKILTIVGQASSFAKASADKSRLSRKNKHVKPNHDYRVNHNTFNDYLSLIGLTLAVILFVILLFLADSQASQAGLFIGLLFLVFVSFGKFVMPRLKSGLRILTFSVLIIALALTAFIGVKKGTPYILKNVRYPLWKGSADMVVRKPMTGFGPGTFLAVFQRFRPADYYNRPEVAPLSDHSHNEYLELASESGLPSLAFFLAFLASILTLSIRKIKNDGVITRPKAAAIPSEWFLLAGLISGLIAILIDGLFSTNLRTFSVVSIFWVMLGFCVAIINAERTTNRKFATRNVKINKDLTPLDKAQPYCAAYLTRFLWMAVMVFSVFSGGFIIREIKGQVYYKEGIASRNAQDWPGAISNYRKALKLDPANLQAAYKLSFVYANANQTEEAINLYREILRISPNFAKTYYNLALLSLKLNDKNSAVAYLNLGLRYDPYDIEAQKILNILTNPPTKTQVPQKL